MTTHHPLARAVALFTVIALCALSGVLHAGSTNFFWTNTVASTWSGAGNWTNENADGTAPDATGQAFYTLNFNTPGTYTTDNDLDTGFLLNRINFGGATARLRGNPLTLTNADTQLPQINQNSSVAVMVSNFMVLTTNVTVGGAGSGQVSLRGMLSGPGELTVNIPGTFRIASTNGILSGTNNYSGGTTVRSGTLVLGSQMGLGTGPITLYSGTVFATEFFEGNTLPTGRLPNPFVLSNGIVTFHYPFSDYKDINISNVVSGSGTLTLSSGSTRAMFLSASNTFSGGVIFGGPGGILNINNANALGSGTFYAQKANFSSGNLRNSSAVTGNLGVPNTFVIATSCYLPIQSDQPMVISGPITGNGNVSKTGAQKLTLSGNNTYTGSTVVIQGTLECTTPNSVGSGYLIISNNAVVNLNYAGTRVITALSLGGTNQIIGSYGSTNSAATYQSTFFAGTGMVRIVGPQPFVDITNLPATAWVPGTTTTQYIAGTNNLITVGGMTWTNTALANEGGVLVPAPGNWNFTSSLVPGDNVIIVGGTNDYGEAYRDTVTVIRAIAPYVNITNANVVVAMSVATATIGGTNNAPGPVGMMRLASVAGATTNFSASMPVTTPWTAAVSNLVAGTTNFVTMTVTNGVGDSASDTAEIYRRPMAFVDITNIVGTINTTNATQTVAGTNNASVVGGMWWTNSLGGGGTLNPVPGNWNFLVTVYPGDNYVTVYGTNYSGDLASDTVNIAPPSSSNDILSCSFGPWGNATIIGTNITIDILPVAPLTNLSPTFVISDYATINPPSGSTNDFTTPKTYVVTSLSGSNKAYRVTVNTWQYKGSLYVVTTPESANLPGSALETNFPLLVRLNANNFNFGQAQPDGRDIRFCTPAGVQYPYQIEEWSNTTASIWVKVPYVAGNTHKEFVMCWDNTNVASLSSGSNVFNTANGFAAVMHLDGALKDEVGTLSPANVGSTVGTGIIGRGRTMAVGQGVNCGSSITNFPSGNQPFSTVFWYKSPGSGLDMLGWGWPMGASKVVYQLASPPHISIDAWFGGAGIVGTVTVAQAQWHHVAHTFSGGAAALYVDGVLDSTGGGGMTISNVAQMRLGGWVQSGYVYAGDMDEVQVSKVNRSANYVKMEYENQKLLQTMVGPIVQTGSTFTTAPTSITMNEDTTTNLSSQAGGARKLYWVYRQGGQDTLVGVDQSTLSFNPGRISGGKSFSIQFRGVYATEVKTNDVPVTVLDTIPDPAFSLLPSTNLWDGRSVMTVTTNISNWAALLACGYTNLTFSWTVDGVAVIKQVNPGTLVLTRSQSSGPMTVRLILDNGGAKITNTTLVTVQEPTNDAWVVRTPATNEVPVHNQFYARDDTGYGTLYYNGTQGGTSPDAFLKVYTNGVLYTNIVQTLVGGAYAFTATLPAGLIQHTVEYGTGTFVLATVTNIVCGDAYLVDGQSNAVTVPDDATPPPAYTNFWIRNYGATLGWGYGTRDGAIGEHKIGHWQMDMASNIVAVNKMPVCIINGAIGGTRIDVHQKGGSIYNNLYNRIMGAKLSHGIRGAFWHQGENNSGADGPDPDYDYKFYKQYFIDMTASWKTDYPNLRYYYIFQVYPSPCGMGPKGDQLREVQRSLPRLYSHLQIMSTIGVQPPVGCHTTRAGYYHFFQLISPLVRQDMYGYVPSTPITAPDVKNVYFTSTNRTQIVMVFGQDVQWKTGSTNLFYLDYQAGKVASGTVATNVITLQLTGYSTATTITYVNDQAPWSVGMTNWMIYGSNGIAALTFADVPITPPAITDMAFIDITNASFTVAATVTNTMIGGTNNDYAVGFMRLVSMTSTTTNYSARITTATPWTAMVSNLVDGTTNFVTMTVTNAAGLSATDSIQIFRLYQAKPSDVQTLDVGRGADYGQVALSWSNGAITVLACTNRTYSINEADWFVLASGVATPWTHTAASNFPSVYYRIVSGTYTSQYAVGKFDVDIAAGSIAWMSFPFGVQAGCDALSEWFGRQLEARPSTSYNYPSLQKQNEPGGTIQNSDYYISGGVTNWSVDDTVVANAGYVLFLPQNHGAVKVTGLGMVQTNNVTMQLPYNSIPWVGLAYDVVMDMRQSGLTNMLQPPQLYSTFNYDFVDSQQTPGGPIWYAEYYRDNWGGNTVNFFPSETGADKIEPGKGYLMFFSTSRAGTGTWTCVKPY